MPLIKFAPPLIGPSEINAVVRVLKSGWLTMGNVTQEFEKKFAAYTGARHAIAVNSCTSGLFLSLVVQGITRGDEVLTTPLTFAATANVIHHLGARPVFVDVERDTFNIDPARLEAKITGRTKAIVAVHYGGHPCEMDAIDRIARKRGLIVIEDAAHATGAAYKGKKIGSRPNLASFSFYVTKPLTTGEGGMITTHNDALASRLRVLRLHGISHDAWKRYHNTGNWYYEVEEAGYKMNTTDINAAIGLAQLARVDAFTRKRRRIFETYGKAFEGWPGVETPRPRPHVRSAYHLYPLRVKKNRREAVLAGLQKRGIGASVHFIPLHLQPFYQKTYGCRRGDFPVAEAIYDGEVSLPIYPQLADRDVRRVIEAVKKLTA